MEKLSIISGSECNMLKDILILQENLPQML